mmetsp:Transcript_29758/g.48047  ORF Transcript_29758/g.48047 Transcript_29758/m.48047 type:complete len:121 (+) Transcript_29758:1062-1424(+)
MYPYIHTYIHTSIHPSPPRSPFLSAVSRLDPYVELFHSRYSFILQFSVHSECMSEVGLDCWQPSPFFDDASQQTHSFILVLAHPVVPIIGLLSGCGRATFLLPVHDVRFGHHQAPFIVYV